MPPTNHQNRVARSMKNIIGCAQRDEESKRRGIRSSLCRGYYVDNPFSGVCDERCKTRCHTAVDVDDGDCRQRIFFRIRNITIVDGR